MIPALQIALLRAVNVGGRGAVAMADLRQLLAKLGFADPRSLLQSGNLVFRSDGPQGAELECLLEAETEKRLGLITQFFVRPAAEWAKIIAANPFPAEAKRDPSHLVLVVFKGAPAAGNVKALQAAITGPEIFRAHGRQAYIIYPAGIGRSRLTAGLMDRTLGVGGTARNWNTVLKLAAMAR